MQWATWIAVVLSAIISFVIGYVLNEPLHWYLFILIVFTGFFINTVAIILKVEDKE